MLVFSLLGAALGFLICAYGVSVHNLWLLFAGRLVSGLTAGNFAIAQAAITDMSTPETTPSRIGYLVLSNGLGFSLGPVMGALLINYHPLLIVALMIVITAIMLAATFNESFTFQGQSVMGVGATIKTYVDSFFGKKVRLLFTSLLFYMVAYTLFFTNLPYFLKARFMEGGTSTGYMLTYFAIIFTIGLLVVLPRLTKRFSLQSIVLVSLWVQIVFYAVFYSMTHQVTVLLVLVPIAISVPFIYVSFVSLISGRTEQANQGKVMGAVGSVIAIAWGVGPIAAGFLASMRILDVFAVAIALMVIALCFLIVFMKKNHEVA
jgi:DHA1 family tetracycline resistance protein-like MFS transporter